LNTPFDGVILYDFTYNREYLYFDTEFHNINSSSVSVASNTSLGLVRGSTLEGKVYVESDGSLSLNGFDNIKLDIENLDDNKFDKSSGEALDDSITSHTSNKLNPHEVTKSQVGLGNVDNTSDSNKPISTATQTALNIKLDKSSIVDNLTSTSTTAPLSANQGKVLNDRISFLNPLFSNELFNAVDSSFTTITDQYTVKTPGGYRIYLRSSCSGVLSTSGSFNLFRKSSNFVESIPFSQYGTLYMTNGLPNGGFYLGTNGNIYVTPATSISANTIFIINMLITHLS
jgi:hypothetical protein